MIIIGKPFIYDEGPFSYLKAHISISVDTVETYMSLSNKFKNVNWRVYENYPPKEWKMDDSGCGLLFQ